MENNFKTFSNHISDKEWASTFLMGIQNSWWNISPKNTANSEACEKMQTANY